MKATLTASGTLRVTPETETEAYALKRWYDGWQPKARVPKPDASALVIGTEVEAAMVTSGWATSTGWSLQNLIPTATNGGTGTCP